MNTDSAINHGCGLASFKLGPSAAIHGITVNDKADVPPDRIIRREADKLKAVILNQFVFADCQMYSASFKKMVSSGPPFTCLHNVVPAKRGFYSSQAIALSGIRNLEPVNISGNNIGLVCEDDDARYCFLGNVFARNIQASRSEQAAMVFETLAKGMNRHGFSFSDIIRTWFFNDHILDWYGEFNKVRTDFFTKAGVFDKTVPASTGIGAGNPHGAALIGNAFSVQPKNGRVKIQTIPSPMQESALSYNSSFSRAIELEFPACRSLFISGTASIHQDGKTAFLDDIGAQIDLTMRVVEALLQSRKMDWTNLFRGIVYFKHPDYVKYFIAYCRKHNIAGSNLVIAFTDICRGGLLFEIEIDALIST